MFYKTLFSRVVSHLRNFQPHPVQQFKQMVDACVLDRKDPIGSHKGRAKYAVQDVNELKAATSFPFPLLDNAAADLPWPSPADLGKALGYQNGVAGMQGWVYDHKNANGLKTG